jgi:hypothetical protein
MVYGGNVYITARGCVTMERILKHWNRYSYILEILYILQTALKKRNVKPKIFCGSAALFSFGSDDMESQRSSVLRDLFHRLSARRPKQWDSLGTDSKTGAKVCLILYLHLIGQQPRVNIQKSIRVY